MKKRQADTVNSAVAKIVRELRAAEAVSITACLALRGSDSDYSPEIEVTLRTGCSTRLSIQIEALEILFPEK